MKLSDNIYVLKLPSTMNPEQFIYPTIISNEENLLLIDTGNPGQIEHLKEAFIKEGLNFNNLKAIVLTHQDIDHVGTLKDIVNDVKDIIVLSLSFHICCKCTCRCLKTICIDIISM